MYSSIVFRTCRISQFRSCLNKVNTQHPLAAAVCLKHVSSDSYTFLQSLLMRVSNYSHPPSPRLTVSTFRLITQSGKTSTLEHWVHESVT